MGKITIYISLKDGELYYCDTEKHNGQTIETKVDPGDSIVWKTEKCPCIKEITNIEIIKGDKDFFSKGPKQKKPDVWKAKVSESAKGEIEYKISYISCEGKDGEKEEIKTSKVSKEENPPKIKA